MVEGIIPREASDRLTIFQAQFDELWRKFQTYSGGEELFGLSITEYPDLHRIKYVSALAFVMSLIFVNLKLALAL